MLTIKKSPTADTRSCDYKNVTQEQLLSSTYQHISDVQKGMEYLGKKLMENAAIHDRDKIEGIHQFHSDFISGFEQHLWWDNHKLLQKHHLNEVCIHLGEVNMFDIIEHIVDCVMAGKARTGTVFPIVIDPKILVQAVENTVNHLCGIIKVED